MPRSASRPFRIECLEARALLSTLQFEFGTTSSPVAAGYVGIAASTYNSTSGYGWAPGSIVYADSRYAPSIDPTLCGFNYGKDDTFLVDLPNGGYTVTPTLGDAAQARDGISLWAQGQQVASGISTAAGQFAKPQFQVSVTNGQLALRVADVGGTNPYFAINDLVITPSGSTSTPPPPPPSPPPPTPTTSASTWLFEFGTSSSPVAQGYTGVAATAFDASKGYGWASGGAAVYADQRWVANANPLTLGFNYSTDATFLVNVPNGTYNVTPALGDALVARSGVSLWIQGQQVASGIASAPDQFTSTTYQANVTNGQLALRFADIGGVSPYFSIVGLSVSPSTTATTPPPTTPPPPPPTPPPSTTPTILIDSNWLTQHGAGPYALTQSNTTYVLETNVATPGTAFVVAAPGVTLDLNGHTVTYGNVTPVVVTNGGFEQGTGRNVTGWNLSGAPAASIASNSDYLYGNQVLRFSGFTSANGAETIQSAPIAIPEANHTYAATVAMSAPGGTQNSPLGTVVIQVFRASDNTLLATGTVGGSYNADGSIATFTPSDTSAVYLKITVTATSSQATTIDIDHVRLSPSFDYGVVASGEWNFNGSANLPTALQWDGATGYNNAGAFTLESSTSGGTLIQGPAAGYGGDAVMAESLRAPLVVKGVTIDVNGDDTSAIYALNDSAGLTTATRTITNNTIQVAPGVDIIHRASDLAQIQLSRTGGNATVTGNTITGVPQLGIMLTADAATQSQTSHLIANNTLVGNSVVTNGYLISLDSVSNLKVLNNTLTAGPGQSARGILLDSQTTANSSNIEIAGNTVDVREAPYREYGAGIPGRALRIRDGAGGPNAGSFINISVHDNSFTGRADASSTLGAAGAWITLLNNPGATAPCSGISFANNLFKAVDATADTGASAKALVLDGIDPGVKPVFTGNTLESNNISLALTDFDGGDISDVTLISNTLRKSAEGATRPYTGIRAGYWYHTIHDVHLIDTQVANGANATIVWNGTGAKDIETGWLLTVTAQNASGSPLSGASVALAGADGSALFSGVSNAAGQVVIPVVTAEYAQPGNDPTAITSQAFGPFSVTVTSGTLSAKRTVTVSGDTALSVTLS